jgi:hypothetical protein
LTLYCSAKVEGKVCFSIRPEELSLSSKNLESHHQNNFPGVIRRIEAKGALTEVEMEVGVIIIAWTLRPKFAKMGLEIGSEVYIQFGEEAVNILQSESDKS